MRGRRFVRYVRGGESSEMESRGRGAQHARGNVLFWNRGNSMMLRKMILGGFALLAMGMVALAVVAQEPSSSSPRSNPNEAHIANCMVVAKIEVQVSAQE